MKPQVKKDVLSKRMSTKAGLAVVNATSASPSNSHTAKDVYTQVNRQQTQSMATYRVSIFFLHGLLTIIEGPSF